MACYSIGKKVARKIFKLQLPYSKMLETLLNPKKAERKPWELFFVGLLYASFSILLVNLIFSNNPVFADYSSILIITFTVMLSLPFMYFVIKFEEEKDIRIRKERVLIKEHGKALLAFVYLFLGFLVAFSLAYMFLPQEIVAKNFHAQVSQYCAINSPLDIEGCVSKNLPGVKGISGEAIGIAKAITITKAWNNVMAIFSNNIYVLIFCILFSLAFGAGAIFILTWNASVIAIAIGILSKNLATFPASFMRYMLHGLPEIAAYFVASLAGGIISIAVIRHDLKEKRFWHIMQDSIDLIILAIVILFVAALIEVFLTPVLF